MEWNNDEIDVLIDFIQKKMFMYNSLPFQLCRKLRKNKNLHQNVLARFRYKMICTSFW